MMTILLVHLSTVVVFAAQGHCPYYELGCARQEMPQGNQWLHDSWHRDGQPEQQVTIRRLLLTIDQLLVFPTLTAGNGFDVRSKLTPK